MQPQGKLKDMKETFYHQGNLTAHFCIQNDTNECGHYLGWQGLWKRLIIQSPLFASILIIVIWVSAIAIFAAFSSYAPLLLFSEPTHGEFQVMILITPQPSCHIRDILKNIYCKSEVHIFLANLFIWLLNSLMHGPLSIWAKILC